MASIICHLDQTIYYIVNKMLESIGVIMLTERQVARVSAEIERLLQSGAFNNLQQIIIEQKYLSEQKTIDIRRLARSQHKPIKLIKREIEKADHKLYRLLKENLIDAGDDLITSDC